MVARAASDRVLYCACARVLRGVRVITSPVPPNHVLVPRSSRLASLPRPFEEEKEEKKLNPWGIYCSQAIPHSRCSGNEAIIGDHVLHQLTKLNYILPRGLMAKIFSVNKKITQLTSHSLNYILMQATS